MGTIKTVFSYPSAPGLPENELQKSLNSRLHGSFMDFQVILSSVLIILAFTIFFPPLNDRMYRKVVWFNASLMAIFMAAASLNIFDYCILSEGTNQEGTIVRSICAILVLTTFFTDLMILAEKAYVVYTIENDDIVYEPKFAHRICFFAVVLVFSVVLCYTDEMNKRTWRKFAVSNPLRLFVVFLQMICSFCCFHLYKYSKKSEITEKCKDKTNEDVAEEECLVCPIALFQAVVSSFLKSALILLFYAMCGVNNNTCSGEDAFLFLSFLTSFVAIFFNDLNRQKILECYCFCLLRNRSSRDESRYNSQYQLVSQSENNESGLDPQSFEAHASTNNPRYMDTAIIQSPPSGRQSSSTPTPTSQITLSPPSAPTLDSASSAFSAPTPLPVGPSPSLTAQESISPVISASGLESRNAYPMDEFYANEQGPSSGNRYRSSSSTVIGLDNMKTTTL